MSKLAFFLFLLFLVAAGPTGARADLNTLLKDLNRRAATSPTEYNASLAKQFHVPQPQVAALMKSVAAPADAFMVLQVSQMTKKPHNKVLHSYKAHRGKGWGVIAKDLGVKPGSPQFHAIKDGRFSLAGSPSHGKDKKAHFGKDKHKDKHKDKNKAQGKKKDHLHHKNR